MCLEAGGACAAQGAKWLGCRGRGLRQGVPAQGAKCKYIHCSGAKAMGTCVTNVASSSSADIGILINMMPWPQAHQAQQAHQAEQ